MNRTLLYTVQRVGEKLDLDAVNSINDSQDAILIAREAEDTFYDLLNRNEWPERYDLINVESVGDTNNPTALRLPSDVLKIVSLRYDVTEEDDIDTIYKQLEQISPEEFLDRIYTRNDSEDNVFTASYKGIDLFVCNDKPADYFAVFDNEFIILDSWCLVQETTVQGVNTVVRGSTIPVFEQNDDYVIPLDITTYPLYLSEVSAAASIALNGTQAPEEERRRNRGISRLRRSAFRTERPNLKNKFGREGTGRA